MSKKSDKKSPRSFSPEDKNTLDWASKKINGFVSWGQKQVDDLAEGGKAVAADIGAAVDQGVTEAERYAKRDGKKATEFQKFRYELEDWWRKDVKPVLSDLSKDVQGACNSAWTSMLKALDKIPDDAQIEKWFSDVWQGAKQKIQSIKNFSIRDAFNNLAEKIGDMVKSISSGKKQEVKKSGAKLGEAAQDCANSIKGVARQQQLKKKKGLSKS
jgi:hypothetical protein